MAEAVTATAPAVFKKFRRVILIFMLTSPRTRRLLLK
jgi:hypothetical protein